MTIELVPAHASSWRDFLSIMQANHSRSHYYLSPTTTRRTTSLSWVLILLWASLHEATALHSSTRTTTTTTTIHSRIMLMRGGGAAATSASNSQNPFVRMGEAYSNAIQQKPILTKSITAGIVFGLSDYLAQRVENTGKKYNWTRTITSIAVGLFYFGPAAHAWYNWIFQILPGTSLFSTLQKAALGQLIFGPSFTCIFFATSLMQSGSFSLQNWARKIKNDLPGAWLAGAGFWPLVDVVSYSVVPIDFIPLFVNLCSLVWTVYLSLLANKR